MKLLRFPFQIAIVASAVLLSVPLSQQFKLINAKNLPLATTEIALLLLVFLAFHAVAYLFSWRAYRSWGFASLLRLLREICFATIANALAGCYYFFLTTVPFNASLVAYVYVLTPLVYLITFLFVAFASSRADRPYDFRLADIPAALLTLLRSALVYVTIAIALVPGVLAYLWKANPDFQSVVESVRVAFNVGSPSEWVLEDASRDVVFDQPMDIRFLNEHQFYVLERPGRIKEVTVDDQWQATTLLDLSGENISTYLENGALSFALHPEFGDAGSDNEGFVFVYYTHAIDDVQHNHLSRFDLSLATSDERVHSELILIEHDINVFGSHNGGTLLFGPDGFLYLSLGESHDEANAQNVTDDLLGGIIRIDVDEQGGQVSAPITKKPSRARTGHYYVPLDNPFVDDDRVLSEYWAIGLRNPFRMWLDPSTNEIWVGDVGSNRYEEINRLRKGANGQWPYREGPLVLNAPRPDPLIGVETSPFYSYQQTALDRAVVGGLLYRGDSFPELSGKYLFADNQSGLIRQLDPVEDTPSARVVAGVPYHSQQGISSLSASPEGEVFVTVLGSSEQPTGKVFRLRRSGEIAVASATEAGAHPPSSATAADASMYARLCAKCHGENGKGDPLRYLDERPDFTSATWQAQVSDQRIRLVILKGGEALGLNEEMPSWQGLVTDREVDRLVETIRSFAAEAAINTHLGGAGK